MTIIEEDKLLKQVARLEQENNELRIEVNVLRMEKEYRQKYLDYPKYYEPIPTWNPEPWGLDYHHCDTITYAPSDSTLTFPDYVLS